MAHPTEPITLLQRTRNLAQSDFVRKVAETQIVRVFLVGVGLVSSVIVARILQPAGRGEFAVAITISAFGVQFLNLGLGASNTYYLSRDRSLLSRLLGNALAVSLGLGGLAALAVWGLFACVPQWAPIQGALLPAALATIPIGLAMMLTQNLLLGLQEVRAYNLMEVSARVLGVVFILGVFALGGVTVLNVFLAVWAAMLISVLFGLARLWRHFEGAPAPSTSLFRRTLGYGAKAYAGALFAYVVLRINILMLTYFLGDEPTGQYSIAVAMADMLVMMPVVVGTIMFPKLAAMESERLKWLAARKVAAGVAGLMAVGCVLAALLARPVVTLLYGEAYRPAIEPFIWLLPGILLMSVNVIFMNYFASIGMPMVTVYSPAIAAVCCVAANALLIPRYGLIGAAVSSVLCYALMLCASAIYLVHTRERRRHEPDPV